MRLRATLLAALVAGATALGAIPARADHMSTREYTNEAGTRPYYLFAPPAARTGGKPLVVYLHGCTQRAEVASEGTRWNDLATAEGFAVVYPEQVPEANGSRCWNWFDPEHQRRDAGEPSIIAGITSEVTAELDVDPNRVYVAGISAGGAMSVVMGATYPDLYAAMGIHSGCEYEGLPCLSSVSALPPAVAGQRAYAAMGQHARVVPFLVAQGDSDLVVPAPNAEIVVDQWLTTNDWADDGEDNGSVDRDPYQTTTGEADAGYSYEVDHYRAPDGCPLAERWLVHGLGHAWSGGDPDAGDQYADPDGPDMARQMYRFFLAHPKSASGCPSGALRPATPAALGPAPPSGGRHAEPEHPPTGYPTPAGAVIMIAAVALLARFVAGAAR